MVEEKKEMKKGYVAPQMEILTIDFQGAPLCASGENGDVVECTEGVDCN